MLAGCRQEWNKLSLSPGTSKAYTMYSLCFFVGFVGNNYASQPQLLLILMAMP